MKLRRWAVLALAVCAFQVLAGRAFANDDVKVINKAANPVPVSILSGGLSATGAAHYANGQVTTSTVAGTLVAARATRRSVTIKNLDASITIYIGAATVSTVNGLPLKPGESISVDTNQLIQVVAASGSPVTAYMESYD
jgi:hypothetical protein